MLGPFVYIIHCPSYYLFFEAEDMATPKTEPICYQKDIICRHPPRRYVMYLMAVDFWVEPHHCCSSTRLSACWAWPQWLGSWYNLCHWTVRDRYLDDSTVSSPAPARIPFTNIKYRIASCILFYMLAVVRRPFEAHLLKIMYNQPVNSYSTPSV